ncbi:MAG: hypothetical protein HYS27_09710 [Deltaproteobacteria bacterium]|nr:hypothetical protein [Deltaproteobacteria bacterium]
MAALELFTIGDSVSQGFQSGAAARPDQAYSTLLARKLGIAGYATPEFPAGGFFLPMEPMLRALERKHGADVSGLEWAAAIGTLNEALDEGEDYYERGGGSVGTPNAPPAAWYPNVSCYGFQAADAWLLSAKSCHDQVLSAGGSGDGVLTGAAQPFYRNALRVLSPDRQLGALNPGMYAGALAGIEPRSQLDWLLFHARTTGVRDVVLWLGANNCLGTVFDLDVRWSGGDGAAHRMGHFERAAKKWNLWWPADFEAEYAQLLAYVDVIMKGHNAEKDWRVFVGNVPYVTIAPLIKGVGGSTFVSRPGRQGGHYFKYYTYFPFEEDFARTSTRQLTIQEAIQIDDTIAEYNGAIALAAAALNGAHGSDRYVVVDFCEVLRSAAWKRNGGNPTYRFPAYFGRITPRPDTKYYHADIGGRVRQGGLFSLDGVHPSALGQGIIAHELLEAMKRAGRASPGLAFDDRDWAAIHASDSLLARPIRVMHEIYGRDELAKAVIGAISLFGVRL